MKKRYLLTSLLSGLLLFSVASCAAADESSSKPTGGTESTESAPETESTTAPESTKSESTTTPTEEEPAILDFEFTKPTKLEYFVGEELDLTGMKLVAIYDDDSEVDVTDKVKVNSSQVDLSKPGQYMIAFAYKEDETDPNSASHESSFPITVIGIKEVALTAPTKVEYFVGEELNLEGLKLERKLTNGTVEDVTDKAKVDTSEVNLEEAGTYTVKVTYGEFEKTFTVKVVAVVITEIEATDLDVMRYRLGEEVNLKGLVVTAKYNNGTTKELTAEEYKVDLSDITPEVADTYEIIISYTIPNGEGTMTYETSLFVDYDEEVWTTTSIAVNLEGVNTNLKPFERIDLTGKITIKKSSNFDEEREIVVETSDPLLAVSYKGVEGMPTKAGTYTLVVSYDGVEQTLADAVTVATDSLLYDTISNIMDHEANVNEVLLQNVTGDTKYFLGDNVLLKKTVGYGSDDFGEPIEYDIDSYYFPSKDEYGDPIVMNVEVASEDGMEFTYTPGIANTNMKASKGILNYAIIGFENVVATPEEILFEIMNILANSSKDCRNVVEEEIKSEAGVVEGYRLAFDLYNLDTDSLVKYDATYTLDEAGNLTKLDVTYDRYEIKADGKLELFLPGHETYTQTIGARTVKLPFDINQFYFESFELGDSFEGTAYPTESLITLYPGDYLDLGITTFAPATANGAFDYPLIEKDGDYVDVTFSGYSNSFAVQAIMPTGKDSLTNEDIIETVTITTRNGFKYTLKFKVVEKAPTEIQPYASMKFDESYDKYSYGRCDYIQIKPNEELKVYGYVEYGYMAAYEAKILGNTTATLTKGVDDVYGEQKDIYTFKAAEAGTYYVQFTSLADKNVTVGMEISVTDTKTEQLTFSAEMQGDYVHNQDKIKIEESFMVINGYNYRLVKIDGSNYTVSYLGNTYEVAYDDINDLFMILLDGVSTEYSRYVPFDEIIAGEYCTADGSESVNIIANPQSETYDIEIGLVYGFCQKWTVDTLTCILEDDSTVEIKLFRDDMGYVSKLVVNGVEYFYQEPEW